MYNHFDLCRLLLLSGAQCTGRLSPPPEDRRRHPQSRQYGKNGKRLGSEGGDAHALVILHHGHCKAVMIIIVDIALDATSTTRTNY